MNQVTRSSLSPARRRLLDLMRQVGFGRIENLIVADGEPLFAPSPRVIREVVFRERLTDSTVSADFALKDQVLVFFRELDALGYGRIEQIEIQHGLPFRMRVEAVEGRAVA